MVSSSQCRKVIKLQGIWERGCFLCRIISFLPQIFSTVKMQGMPLQPTLTFALLVFKDLNLNIREKCSSTAVAIVTFKEESSGHWKVGWNQEESIWGKRETGRRRKGCFKNGRSQKEVWGIKKKEVSHLRSTMDVMLKKIKVLGNRSRRNNLVIWGLGEVPNESHQKLRVEVVEGIF